MDCVCSTFSPHISRSTFLSPFGFPKTSSMIFVTINHLVMPSSSSTSISTLFVESFATKTWWSSACIEMLASDIMLDISFWKIFHISGPSVLPCGHPRSLHLNPVTYYITYPASCTLFSLPLKKRSYRFYSFIREFVGLQFIYRRLRT